jgi:hypothetical protein
MVDISKYIAYLLDGDGSDAAPPSGLVLDIAKAHFDEPPPSLTAIDRVIERLGALTESARDRRSRVGYFSGREANRAGPGQRRCAPRRIARCSSCNICCSA